MLSWRMIWKQSALILFFGLLGVITLSPLIFNLGTQVPAEIDYFHFNWNYWWIRHALETDQNPYYTQMVMVPFEQNLALHSLTPIWFPVYALLEPLAGQLRATNLILWISVVLTGWTTYLFLKQQTVHPSLALLGGVILMLSPNMRGQLLGTHLDLIGFFWMPVVLLLWYRVAKGNWIGWSVLVGLALWGAWLTDPVVNLWNVLLLGPFALLTLVQAQDRAARVQLVLHGLLAIAVVLICAWLIGPLQPLLKADMDAFTPLGYQTARDFALSLKIWEWQPQKGEPRGFGMLLVFLTVMALLMRSANHRRWFWLLVALPPLILALGPDITIGGTLVPIPFRLVSDLTDKQYRVPARFVPVATFALIVFVGQTFTPWIKRLRYSTLRAVPVGMLMVAYLVDTHTFVPLATKLPPQPYQFYTMMRNEDADYVVLEVPTSPASGTFILGWQSMESWHPEAMFYGITHEKRMISGLLSRIPQVEEWYYQLSPLIGWLAGAHGLDAETASAELARMVNGQWGAGEVTAPIGYVVVHQDWLPADRSQEILTFFNMQSALCFMEVERDAVLYRTTSHPEGCPPRTPPETESGVYRIAFGQPGDEGFIGPGWYRKEQIGGTPARWTSGETQLYATLPPDQAYTITLRAVAFNTPRTIQVTANGQVVGQVVITPGDWGDYTLDIPMVGSDGKLEFILTADSTLSAAEAGLSADTRPLAVAYTGIEFRVIEGS
ncbi:MAG TPA: hypothetical protein VHP83_16565 [Aggregatilineaceae bacterium]|nr:hypothetical protein [Aggregatilineaceae bacterium]